MLFSIIAACFVATAMAHEGHDHNNPQNPKVSGKVELTIYYESLCDDSIKFFKKQLSPMYETMKNYISLDFVPFGKAEQRINNGTYSFTCHHGEKECYGNIVQACAVKILHDENIYKVINCLMTEVDPKTVTNNTYPTAKCMKKFDLQETGLDACTHSLKGLEYLSEMGNRTKDLNPKLQSVPSVEVNKKFDYGDSKAAVENLKSFVCKKLKDSKKDVKECASGSGVVASSLLLLAFSSFIRTLISP